MRHYLTDRGIRGAITSGVVIATLAIFFAEQHRPVWTALGVAWVAATAFAVVTVRHNHRRTR